MKTILFTLIVIMSSFSLAKKPSAKVKMDLNQIWTFNFEELHQLPVKEQDEFTQNLAKEAESNPVLKKITETSSLEKLKVALSSEEKWNPIEQKISSFCQDTHNYSSCEKLAKIRTDLLFKYSPRK